MPPPFYQSSSSSNSIPSTATPFLNPHRTDTQTPIPSNNSHPHRHTNTCDPGTSTRPVNVNPGLRPTRHLVTMARPPDQQSSSPLSPVALSPLALEPPATARSASAFLSPPPASSILFSQSPATALKLPLTPPPTTVQSTPVKLPIISSVPSGTAHRPQSISSFGRVAGFGSLAGDVVSTLQSVLLTPGTGVDQLSLQAVVQGRPDADYQWIINALIKLHQQQQQQFASMKLQIQQPLPPAIDYKALIAEVQKVQAQEVATAQQQRLAQLHTTSARLQETQQQPQTAAQQYQALVQQRYQQQAAAQQQQQQQLQEQRAAQYQAFLKQQQATAQQNQSLLNNAARPPYLNLGGDASGGGQSRPLSDPKLSATGDNGGLFFGGNFGGQDSPQWL